MTTIRYTFNARNDDYASRFRLVFVANDAHLGGEGSDDFAFISNGEIIVNGTGTLQVIDLLGRQLFTAHRLRRGIRLEEKKEVRRKNSYDEAGSRQRLPAFFWFLGSPLELK